MVIRFLLVSRIGIRSWTNEPVFEERGLGQSYIGIQYLGVVYLHNI